MRRKRPAARREVSRGLYLRQRDLRFGRKADVLGHAGLAPPHRIVSPVLGKIEPVGDRQAGRMMGDRQRNGHLAIVLLAELPAILPRHSDRMGSLLGNPVSSMIKASIGPLRCIVGTTKSRTFARTLSSDQGA